MMRCPRCQSPHILSNRFDPAHLDRAMEIAKATQAIGIRRVSVLAGLGAMAMRAMDELRKEWRCGDCDHRFDA